MTSSATSESNLESNIDSTLKFSRASTKRLMRDYREIHKEGKNLNIFVEPLESDIYEWHGNMVPLQGRYQGIVIHFIMKFPTNYPTSPPKVTLCTGITHSNIIEYQGDSNYMCLDILNNFFWSFFLLGPGKRIFFYFSIGLQFLFFFLKNFNYILR